MVRVTYDLARSTRKQNLIEREQKLQFMQYRSYYIITFLEDEDNSKRRWLTCTKKKNKRNGTEYIVGVSTLEIS